MHADDLKCDETQTKNKYHLVLLQYVKRIFFSYPEMLQP